MTVGEPTVGVTHRIEGVRPGDSHRRRPDGVSEVTGGCDCDVITQ